MASLQWNDHIRVVVSEMSHKQYLACSVALNDFAFSGIPKEMDAFGYWRHIVEKIMPYSRIEVYRDNLKLPNGEHDIDGACITLPVTAECLDELPASLATFLIESTASENRVVFRNFTRRMAEMTAMLSAPASGNTLSGRSA